MKQIFKNDSYFLGDVTIEMIPHSEFNTTDIKATVIHSEEADMHSYGMEWELTIPFFTESPMIALEEIKKDKYVTVGASTTIYKEDFEGAN